MYCALKGFCSREHSSQRHTNSFFSPWMCSLLMCCGDVAESSWSEPSRRSIHHAGFTTSQQETIKVLCFFSFLKEGQASCGQEVVREVPCDTSCLLPSLPDSPFISAQRERKNNNQNNKQTSTRERLCFLRGPLVAAPCADVAVWVYSGGRRRKRSVDIFSCQSTTGGGGA